MLSNISKRFGGVAALRGATVHAHAGEVHGLIGENGAGKSTLVKILSGAITPDAGDVRFRGTSLVDVLPNYTQTVRIATAYQELSLVPDWDVATNLMYSRSDVAPRGRVNARAARRAAADVMDELGVRGIDPKKVVRDLRLAERQTLEIMRALIAKPQILILDEPTSALTPDQVLWFFEQVRAFVSSQTVVLFISHRLEEIRSLCHRVTVLRDGTNVGGGLAADFTGRQLVHLGTGGAAGRALVQEQTRESSARPDVRARLSDFASPPELRPTTLEVRVGEIIGVAGLEGQGQLELFLSLYGARRSTGSAELDGKRLSLRSPTTAIAQGIGLVPHDRGLALALPLSIRDNVTLGSLGAISHLGLIRRDREQAVVDDAMRSLRVRARNSRSAVETLSGGNQQKVLLGRVLSLQPKLLLLYDPTRGVDVGTKAEIFHLVRRQAEAGVAVIFYSTDVSELIALCDRVLVLHDGAIAAKLVGDAITEREIIGAVIGSARHD